MAKEVIKALVVIFSLWILIMGGVPLYMTGRTGWVFVIAASVTIINVMMFKMWRYVPPSWLTKSKWKLKLLARIRRNLVYIKVLAFLAVAMIATRFFFGIIGLIITCELIVFTMMMTPLIIGIAWKTGYLATLFTTVGTGNIKFVDVGASNKYTYINIPGKVLIKGEIIDERYSGETEDRKTWVQKKFGRYWVGFPFLGNHVHTFYITHDRAKRQLTQDMTPADWIEYGEGPEPTDELRWKVPRAVLVPDVKFGDNIEANILVLCRIEFNVPLKPVYIQKGDFFETFANLVRSGVLNYCKGTTAAKFAVCDRLDDGEMSRFVVGTINKQIGEEVGIKLIGVSVPIYNESKSSEEEALEAAELARLNGLATVAKAEAEAAALIKTTEAENKKMIMDATAQAEADRILSQASVADVVALATHFSQDLGASPDVAVHSATAMGRATRLAKHDSPITTFVDGGGQSNVSIPLSERKVILPPTTNKKG